MEEYAPRLAALPQDKSVPLESGEMALDAVGGTDAELLADLPHGRRDASRADDAADELVNRLLTFGDAVFHRNPFCHELTRMGTNENHALKNIVLLPFSRTFAFIRGQQFYPFIPQSEIRIPQFSILPVPPRPPRRGNDPLVALPLRKGAPGDGEIAVFVVDRIHRFGGELPFPFFLEQRDLHTIAFEARHAYAHELTGC